MEPPGTAPGSDPLITSAFMSIVPLPERLEYKGLGSVLEERSRSPRGGSGPQCNTLINPTLDKILVLAALVCLSSPTQPNLGVA